MKHALENMYLTDADVDDWVENLTEIYCNVAAKYSLNLDDFIGYMREKHERNEDSHFTDRIRQYGANPQSSFAQFIYNETDLRNVFAEDELAHLHLTFERCGVDLQATPR